MTKSNIHKKMTFEDKFDRRYACWVKNNHKAWKWWKIKARRDFRRIMKEEEEKMSQLIDTNKLKNSLRHLYEYENFPIADIELLIDHVSTIDTEPIQHGRWEWDGYVYDMPWRCSECSCLNEDNSSYCPNCGAKMDETSIVNMVINNCNATTVINNDNAMSTETRRENMPDSMMFPKTVDEFMEKYKIVDTDEIYTNGAELVPIFRMKQWFEHVNVELKQAYVIVDEDGNMECSNCGSSFCFDNYCGHCGAKLIGERKVEVEYE